MGAKHPNPNSRMGKRLRFLMERDGAICCYCKGPLRISTNYYDTLPDRATVDHIIPYSKGGSDALKNTVLACYGCNNNRGNGHIKRKKPFTSAADYADMNERLAAIDKMFEEASVWGSWMAEASSERRDLCRAYRRIGIAIKDKWELKTADGRLSD